ncbi:MAG: hypothetical protein ACE5LF_07385 [Alphaproteobacteria bacterium]
MKEDSWLIAIVFLVWLVLSVLYFTVPMIYMPVTGRVWGMGALLFLVLAAVIAWAAARGRARQRVNDPRSLP